MHWHFFLLIFSSNQFKKKSKIQVWFRRWLEKQLLDFWMDLLPSPSLAVLPMFAMTDSETFMSLIQATIEFASLIPRRAKVCFPRYFSYPQDRNNSHKNNTVSTYAGSASQGLVDGPVSSAKFQYLAAIACQTSSMFVLDNGNLRKIQNGSSIFFSIFKLLFH